MTWLCPATNSGLAPPLTTPLGSPKVICAHRLVFFFDFVSRFMWIHKRQKDWSTYLVDWDDMKVEEMKAPRGESAEVTFQEPVELRWKPLEPKPTSLPTAHLYNVRCMAPKNARSCVQCHESPNYHWTLAPGLPNTNRPPSDDQRVQDSARFPRRSADLL